MGRLLGTLDLLRRHRDRQSEAYGARAAALGSPCLAGCHGCCHQVVLVELPDALAIARHLLAHGRATTALRAALAEHADLAERLPAAEVFASGRGCAFLDPTSPGAACTIYEVRPHDCRIWFIHGVPDGTQCAPGGPERPVQHLKLPALEEADLLAVAPWKEELARAFGARPVWVPLALGVLAALDLHERGAAAMETWGPRLDAATQRSFALADDGEP